MVQPPGFGQVLLCWMHRQLQSFAKSRNVLRTFFRVICRRPGFFVTKRRKQRISSILHFREIDLLPIFRILRASIGKNLFAGGLMLRRSRFFTVSDF